jgi:hypothetical protein
MLMQLSGALPTFAHKPRLMDYFVLAFGVMVGTAWLVIMDNTSMANL